MGTYSVGVTPELHVPQLFPGPISVQLGGPHEAQVDAQSTVGRRALQTDEHAERHRRPCRILGPAVEAHLHRGSQSEEPPRVSRAPRPRTYSVSRGGPQPFEHRFDVGPAGRRFCHVSPILDNFMMLELCAAACSTTTYSSPK